MILCVTLAQRDQRLKLIIYYMALSHKDWELPNLLAEIDNENGLDFPI